jgi:hypothetical protein
MQIQYIGTVLDTGSASFWVAGSLDPYLKCVSGIKGAKGGVQKKVTNSLSRSPVPDFKNQDPDPG